METNKKIIWTFSIILIIIGLFFIFMGIFQYDYFRNFLCVIIGIGMIITNLPSLIFSIYGFNFDSKRKFILFTSLIGIGLGAFYIPFHGTIMSIICGAFLLILPTLRIIFEHDHLQQFKKEILLYIIGLFLTLNMLDVMFQLIVVIVGALIIVFAIYGLVKTYVVKKREKKKNSINASIIIKDAEPIEIEYKDENMS